MAAVALQNIFKSFGGNEVLSGVTLDLHKGEKVGLIGANGSGKTTLFRLITGNEPPDMGTVTISSGTTIGYLPQEPNLTPGARLIDVVSSVFDDHRALESQIAELSHAISDAHGTADEPALMEKYDRLRARFEAAGGYDYEIRMREVLGGLSFSPDEYAQLVEQLSGGQKCRAALARLLLSNSDFLLLDEPTNHLDIDATRWLEKYLAGYHGGAVIISHDRYLLDRVVTKIIEVEDHKTEVYPTNYTNYAQAKRIRQLQAVRDYEKQSAWLAHQRDYIAKVKFAKDSAKQARGRQKYLDRMEADGRILGKPKSDAAKLKLQFGKQVGGGDMVIRCEKAGKAFGDLVLIRDLDFEMTRGEKIGIIGPNGVGKTTLLRMLLGQTPTTSGTVRLFQNLTVGYYDQEHRDLDASLTVIEAVRQVRPEIREAEARSYLALFLFRGDSVFKRVGSLSGGEQSRVLLARLVWQSPQVLILDEPTNHLDIPAREALEESLTLFPGSILMVSHDRYFLDRVAERLLVLPERGKHELVAGNWSTYASLLAQREEVARAEKERERAAAREAAQRRASQGGSSSGSRPKSRSKYAAKRIEDLESQIIEQETRLKDLEASFANPVLMKDAARSKQLHEEYHALKASLDELNTEWEAAVDAGS
ncbi:MAG: ABC-F family ATP-binding cassette domain-containing protein [Planctomycetia bacterium]|nr:ABC-F family ATP-binding cassette domain-containing protein [Planctomycetia bacterium]